VELTLLRHGEVEGRANVFRGRSDPPLSATGWARMTMLGNQLAQRPPDVIYASPARRCHEPAERLASSTGAPLRVLPDLREMDFGDWEELSPQEVAARWPEELRRLYEAPENLVIPGGESFMQFRERVVSSFTQDIMREETASALVLAHAGSIRVLLTHLLQMDMRQALRIELPPGARCILKVHSHYPALLRALIPPERA
jgi:broad specificity phosphatase PhoE